MSNFKRTAFTTKRVMEFFSESELTTQMGYKADMWPLVLIKELIDNGLDACEKAGSSPQIVVVLKEDSVTVCDSGPGLSADIIKKSLDYTTRTSDKKYYVSPTRGQLGNALKCVWTAAFVANGEGRIEVMSCGVKHSIRVRVDQLNQEPNIKHEQESSSVKSGTFVTIHWPGIASAEIGEMYTGFYRTRDFEKSVSDLLIDFAAFNPHASFTLQIEGEEDLEIVASAENWNKWRTSDATSAHWYTVESLRDLIVAEVRTGSRKTVRDFIGEFDGLAGSQYRKKVLDLAGKNFPTHLPGLVHHKDINEEQVIRLLEAMKMVARPVKPARLGLIGKEHLQAVADFRRVKYSRYASAAGFTDRGGLPFVLEVLFGAKEVSFDLDNLEDDSHKREITVGVNNSPIFKIPSDEVSDMLANCNVENDDPVVLFIHLSCPRFHFVDHGKGALVLDQNMENALKRVLVKVTKEFKKLKRQAGGHLTAAQRQRMNRKADKEQLIKPAAFEVMAEAYRLASADGTLPANARQIMYQARPLVLALTGGKCWSNSNYFTQTLLNEYKNEHEEETAEWDIVYDARGHFAEPHTRAKQGIGTINVRNYVASWDETADFDVEIETLFPTSGPRNRFRFAMFIEKEGFDPILERSGIAKRYDIAVFSSKGHSTVATRKLIDSLSQADVTILTAHDFDVSGMSIAHLLANDNGRYTFETAPKVIDLGLRLKDVQTMKLQSEPVDIDQTKDPRENLRERGANKKEIDFLITGQEYSKTNEDKQVWTGNRVELNAMTSAQFIGWLERKFKELGVTKIIPDTETLDAAWRRSQRVRAVQEFIDASADETYAPAPNGLERKIRNVLKERPELSWDQALLEV